MALRWSPRAHPLEPAGVAASGAAARALARRLLGAPPERLAGLRGCLETSRPLLLLLGEAALLPWVDGVVYLGREPRAPTLLVPTTLTADVPPDLLLRAARRRLQGGVAAILPAPSGAGGVLIDVSVAGAIDPDALASWLEPSS